MAWKDKNNKTISLKIMLTCCYGLGWSLLAVLDVLPLWRDVFYYFNKSGSVVLKTISTTICD